MVAHREFLSQLENFKHEADVAAQYLYSDMAVQHAASKSKKLLGRLNNTPTFWLTHGAGMQVAAYVAIGRVFDTKSRYNINALLDAFENNLSDFSREALAARKREGRAKDPEWLPEYLAKSHYPSKKDVNRLRAKVSEYREVYDRAVKPARHKYIAHREKKEHLEVQALFAGGKVRELWRLVTFLHAFHEALWQQYHNGQKPVLRPIRYSVKAIYDSGEEDRSGPHERIIAETRKLMEFIQGATANSSIERPAARRRRSDGTYIRR
jgi:hypothetical protein